MTGAAAWARPVTLIVGVGVAAIVADLVPSRPGSVIYALCGVVAVVALLYGARVNQVAQPLAWRLLALGIGVWVCGDTLWDWLLIAQVKAESDWFHVANVLYLAMYPVLLTAIVILVRARRRSGDLATLVDSWVIFVTSVLILRIFVVDPHFSGVSLDGLFTTSFVVGDAALLSAVALLVITPGMRNASAWLLGAALLMMLVADVLFDLEQRIANLSLDDWINPLYPLSYAVVAAAALHPSARHLTDPTQGAWSDMSRTRLALLTSSLLLLPAAVLFANRKDVFVLAAAVGLVAAMGLRLAMLYRNVEQAHAELEVSERRYRVLASLAPVGIFEANADLEITFANAETDRLIGRSATGMSAQQVLEECVDPRDSRGLRLAAEAVLNGNLGQAQIRMRDRDGTERWVAWRGVPSREGPGPFAGAVVSALDISQLKEAEAMLSLQATHDLLTGLPNRRMLFDRLTGSLARLARQPGKMAVLFLDLDGFKEVNDDHGHKAGDEVLKVLSKRLLKTVRADDTVARFGGDEFVVILEGVVDEEHAELVARKIVTAIEIPVVVEGQELRVSSAVGIAITHNPQENPDTLVSKADTAMYVAKEAGRGKVRFSTERVGT